MAHKMFDVQTAVLYDAPPRVEFDVLLVWLNELAAEHGIGGPFKVLPGASDDSVLTVAGAGVNASISIQDTPFAKDAFDLALKSPILHWKSFDFSDAIRKHNAGVLIVVSDGEVPMPLEARQPMASEGVIDASDPEVKLTVLHILMQGVVTMNPPLMVDFCPSQSLLCPQECALVSTMGLPVPILFHPMPIANAPAPDGSLRVGMEAIHATHLIGAGLELEGIPEDMPIATRINMLATLIMEKRAGNMPLEHGDTLQSDDGLTQYVRHEADELGKPKIIVSYDTEPPQRSDTKNVLPIGQRAFQDRVSKLKAQAPTDDDATREQPLSPPMPPLGAFSEDPEELRARVRETIGTAASTTTQRSGLMMGPVKVLGGFTVIALLFAFLNSPEEPAMMASEKRVSSLPQAGVPSKTNDSNPTVATGVTIIEKIEGVINR